MFLGRSIMFIMEHIIMHNIASMLLMFNLQNATMTITCGRGHILPLHGGQFILDSQYEIWVCFGTGLFSKIIKWHCRVSANRGKVCH